LARRGGREVVSGGSLAFGQKRGDWLEAWEEKKYIKREGAPDCWLVFGQGRGQPL